MRRGMRTDRGAPMRQIRDFTAWHNCGQRLWGYVDWWRDNVHWIASPIGGVKVCPKCGQPLPKTKRELECSSELRFGETRSNAT